MPAPVAFYWVCKGLFLLGMVRIMSDLVRGLLELLWFMVGDMEKVLEQEPDTEE